MWTNISNVSLLYNTANIGQLILGMGVKFQTKIYHNVLCGMLEICGFDIKQHEHS